MASEKQKLNPPLNTDLKYLIMYANLIDIFHLDIFAAKEWKQKLEIIPLIITGLCK